MNYKTTQKYEAPNCASPKKSSLNRLGVIVLFLVFGLGLANLVGTNALATQGVVLDQIIRDTEAVAKENSDLTVEISQVSNLSYIESAAIRLGFERVKSNLIISPWQAVAAAIQR